MPYLAYLSDDVFRNEVKHILDKAMAKRKSVEKDFYKNVIDPFGALFEASAFPDHETWKKAELAWQSQKTVQNHIGTFHQKILGQAAGWQDLGKHGVIDLVCEEKKIIAEIKNKFNTVKGSDQVHHYYLFDDYITQKNSNYKGYRAYFATIIPKITKRLNEPFTPSDNKKARRCPENPNIRIIDGASFYKLVTGREHALKELHQALPQVIEYIYRNDYADPTFKFSDIAEFMRYFDLAYKK